MNTFVPDKRPRLSRHVRLHTDKVSGAPVLLLPETIIVLNQTGYDILRLNIKKLAAYFDTVFCGMAVRTRDEGGRQEA
jgi:hypothetical protein